MRQGGEKRGNCRDRLMRLFWFIVAMGDIETGTVNCSYCQKTLRIDKGDGSGKAGGSHITADRVEAGGTYARGNILPSCIGCNVERGDMPFGDWCDAKSLNENDLRELAEAFSTYRLTRSDVNHLKGIYAMT